MESVVSQRFFRLEMSVSSTRTAMLKLNASPPGPLDAYEEGLRQLSTGFPQYWGHVSVVEDQLRSERRETLRGRVESTVQKTQFPGSWGPNRPRAAVIAYSAYGAGADMTWWCTARGRLHGATALKGKGSTRTAAREIAWRRVRHRWHFRCGHLPAESNAVADSLSRFSAIPAKAFPLEVAHGTRHTPPTWAQLFRARKLLLEDRLGFEGSD